MSAQEDWETWRDEHVTPTPSAFEKLCETMPELAQHVQSVGHAGEPTTGNGDRPSGLSPDFPPLHPESVSDYMQWVEFRSRSLGRWIKTGGPKAAPVILETVARLEGDLQQIRHLVKAEKAASVPDDKKIDDLLARMMRGPREG